MMLERLQRPSAKELLKHPFIRNAPKKTVILTELIDRLSRWRAVVGNDESSESDSEQSKTGTTAGADDGWDFGDSDEEQTPPTPAPAKTAATTTTSSSAAAAAASSSKKKESSSNDSSKRSTKRKTTSPPAAAAAASTTTAAASSSSAPARPAAAAGAPKASALTSVVYPALGKVRWCW
jgi:serine/threonine-protein kinase 24/25/MST4